MKNNAPPLQANGTIAPSVFVVLDTTADNMVLAATPTLTTTANQPIIGISQPSQRDTPGLVGSDTQIAANKGDFLEIYSLGDVCMVQAGAAFTRGSLLAATAAVVGPPAYPAGMAIAATQVGTTEVGAVALQSASGVGVLVLVQILSRKY